MSAGQTHEARTPSAPAGGVLVPPAGVGGGARALRQAVGSATVLAALITLGSGTALTALYRRYLSIESRDAVVAQITPYGTALGAALAHRIAVLEGFEAYLRIQGDRRADDRNLERYTADLQASTRGIRAVELVRDGRIIAVAPRAGNEGALGLDLRRHPDPDVRRKWQESERSGRITVTGPRPLAQGGLGLILRQRLTRPGSTEVEMAALVLDMEPLLEEAGLVAPAGVRVAIRDSAGRLLVGHDDIAGLAPVEVAVRLPDDVWRLQAIPARGWGAAVRLRLALFTLGTLLSAILITLIVYLVASRQAALISAVEERTGSLRRAVEELHESAAQRERAETQLRQSQRLESLGRFAGGIAHDFNNLLTVIMGSIAFARGGLSSGADADADLQAADQAAQRARELTRKLLAFARQREIEAQLLDLNALVAEMQPLLRRLLSARIALHSELAPGLWPVFADPGLIEQVITNLVVNAGDALPDGGEITLRTWNAEVGAATGPGESLTPGEYAHLAVEDTGTGMPPEVLQRAFDPFFTTKEVGKGTGLGLATAYGIARQAGGDVRLESELGKGTRAIIRLPRMRGVPTRRPDRISGPTARMGGGETILLVEDEMSVRRVISRILGGAGYKLIAAEDGDSALRRLDPAQRIDLLVTDVVTPGLGGRALAERILERDPRTRVLFISGYAADERFQDLLERPGIAYLAKPFTIEQLQGAVRHLLDLPPPG